MPKLMNTPRLLYVKIKTIRKFKTVAKAIQMVAMACLRNLRKKMVTRYTSLMLAKLFFRADRLSETSFYDTETQPIFYRNTLYVVYSTDKSNCAPVTSGIRKKVLPIFRKEQSNNNSFKIICLGKKLACILKQVHKKQLSKVFLDLSNESVAFYMAYAIASKIVHYDYDSCCIIFTRLLENNTQQIVKYEIDSINILCSKLFMTGRASNVILDLLATKSKFDSFSVHELYFFNLCLLLLDALEELEYCEITTRANTMENAVKNITNLLDMMTLRYNKLRQSLITTELLEIINAAEVMR